MLLRTLDFIFLLCFVELSLSLIPNETKVDDLNNDLKGVETRRKAKKKDRSTSSEGLVGSSSETDKESLGLSTQTSSSSESDLKNKPKSSAERTGWRKWHRKCSPCPEDMLKKWRDPSIQWICGAYQRARRSFKSLCMMHYRNCQDGTMFVKIGNHRCSNDSLKDQPHGIHFFYDYKVTLSSESSKTEDSQSSISEESSDSF